MTKEEPILDESRQGEVLLMTQTGKASGRKLYLENYGCAMNFSDSEIVASILAEEGYSTTDNYKEADLILINTCSIREGAEQRVRSRLKEFNAAKKRRSSLMIGVLGCMAERLKSQFLEEERSVDLVVGPDAYRTLPELIKSVESGQKGVNVLLSLEETYADISPVRLDSNGITAFISITRGCDNMCSFCVVPFTRGRERSRDPETIVREAKELFEKGYREVTLLGQNVDSYLWGDGRARKRLTPNPSPGGEGGDTVPTGFAVLLEMVAHVSPELRVRFSTSHPKDMTDDVLHVMKKYENICKHIHLPVQSGSNVILERMNRGYSREWYVDRVARIRSIIPECGISTDIITGFCGETEGEHLESLSLMEEIKFDFAYMYIYSDRPGTAAHKNFPDDVSEEIKKRRLNEVIALQHSHTEFRTAGGVGRMHRVLIEGVSKKSALNLYGRNSRNTVVVFPKGDLTKGIYTEVQAIKSTRTTLIGENTFSQL